VADGHGVAVLPLRSVAVAVEGIDVRQLREPALNRRLYAVARASALSRPVVATVIDSFAAAVR